MRITRTMSFAAVGALLAIGSLAVPAAAANPRIAVVQGMPGRTVDVCLGQTEVRSGLRYGRWVEKVLAPGTYTLRFRTATAGKCKGTVLARTLFAVSADQDITFVGKARTPRFIWFHNDDAPAPIGNVNWMAVRHAADVGPVLFSLFVGGTIGPSAAPSFSAGQEWRFSAPEPSGIALAISAYKPTALRPFERLPEILTVDGRRHEFILVGSTLSNARFVTMIRPTIPK